MFLDLVLCFCDTAYSTYICFYIKYTFIFSNSHILISLSNLTKFYMYVLLLLQWCLIIKTSILFFSFLTIYLDSRVLFCFVLRSPSPRTVSHVVVRLVWNSVCSWDWLWLTDPPAFTTYMLGLQTCVSLSSFSLSVLWVLPVTHVIVDYLTVTTVSDSLKLRQYRVSIPLPDSYCDLFLALKLTILELWPPFSEVSWKASQMNETSSLVQGQ